MHTPGPWEYNDQLADNGNKSTDMYGRSRALSEPICTIPHDDITDEGYEEVRANARLIAAAPDLLEAIELAEATIVRLAPEPRHGFSSVKGSLDVIRTAIAKAKRGAPCTK